jgi:hypothetical protein
MADADEKEAALTEEFADRLEALRAETDDPSGS